MKMKIALITIHYANSYGGCLQALASQTALSRYGDVEIINYKSKELKKTLDVIRFGYKPRDVLRIGKDIFRFFPRRRLVDKFKRFMSDKYNLTPDFSSTEQLRSIVDQFDVFVCGSDQIWNPQVVGDLDLNYMLAFAGEKKKLSLSSSVGSYWFSEKELGAVRSHLSGFSSISVREQDVAEKLKLSLCRDDIERTLDPTLLLNKKQWLDLLNIDVGGGDEYIFVYTLKKSKLICESVEKIARLLDLKVVAIDQDPFIGYNADSHVMDASPYDYVRLIAGAKFVVTNSFHGTAFSVNFNIPFITLLPEAGLNRIKGFLESVGLQDRLVTTVDAIDSVLDSGLDFIAAEEKLEVMRVETYDYIENALGVMN